MSHSHPPLGQLITADEPRDCVHVALAPVQAAINLSPGAHVQLTPDGRATTGPNPIGIIDPFLKTKVKAGQWAFLLLYPGTITSLRHSWEHPAMPAIKTVPVAVKSESEAWMRKWAMEHMGMDHYQDYRKPLSEDVAYAAAIEAGHRNRIGPYESARDHIDSEW